MKEFEVIKSWNKDCIGCYFFHKPGSCLSKLKKYNLPACIQSGEHYIFKLKSETSLQEVIIITIE